MQENEVLAIIASFTKKYLTGVGTQKDEQLLGFVVIDEVRRIIVASTFDPNYGRTMMNPIKSWTIYNSERSGMRAFVMDQREDFKNFVEVNCV